MARIPGSAPKGWYTWLVYRFLRKTFGRVPEPVRIAAHHEQVFRGHVAMERAEQKAHSLPEALKSLVSIRVATRVGCPF